MKKCPEVISVALAITLTLGCATAYPTTSFAEEPTEPTVTLYDSMRIDPVVTHDKDEYPIDPTGLTSSYSSTLVLGVPSHVGITRYYSGTNISISMDAYTTGSGGNCDPSFSVELHRAHGFYSEYIGSAAFWRDGYSKATWSNVGPGDYYFKFVRCMQDNKTIYSNNVRMWNS